MTVSNAIAAAMLVALALLVQTGVAPAQEEQSGVIFGRIVNGTIEEPASDIVVTLSTFAGGTLQASRSSVTDEDGRFEFLDVDTDPEAVYAVSVTYFGIAYSTGRMSFETASQGLDVTLNVYEPTEDQSLVTVRSRGVILTDVSPTRGEIGLLDIIVLELREQRVLVADAEGRTVSFPVPRNASRVTPLPGTGYDLQTATIEGATVFGTEPLLPGEATVTLSYTVPYTSDRLAVELQAAYDTELFRILLPKSLTSVNKVIQVDAPGFTYVGEEEIGPQIYDVWTRESLGSGERVRLTYTELTRSQIQPNTLNKLAPGAIASLAVIGALAVVVWRVRGRRLYRERPVVLEPQLAMSLEEDRSELIEQLQALDASLERGLIDEADYPEYRVAILEQLRIINRQMVGQGVED